MMDEAVTWTPLMDVCEVDDSYEVNAELPGVEAKDVSVDFSDSELSIKGERRIDALCETERYHMLEGQHGRFHRKFSLPEPVDSSRIQWELNDGILHVIIPKSGKAGGRMRGGSH